MPQCAGQSSNAFSDSFINFETAPIHPIALSPDGTRLAVCNLPDGKLEIFEVTTAGLRQLGRVPVGLDPVTVRFRDDGEAWVVNHVSDSISIVEVATLRVTATVQTKDTPEDVLFAGSPRRAFVSCSSPNSIEVFDAATRQWSGSIAIGAERPKSLSVSRDGRKVYAAIFESGNRTTIIGGKFRNLLFFGNAISLSNGPYAGQNPPPNAGMQFFPPLNESLPANIPPPLSGLIVRKNAAGRWMDDNFHDWTEFVSGTNAHLSQRVVGWDLQDRDLAIIDTADYSVTYATGLMNICMAAEPNPASGKVAVVGTDAINEVRFEPNLKGKFVQVKIAMVNATNLAAVVKDLNPHLDYNAESVLATQREKSIGDPRAVVWNEDGARGYVAGMGSRNVVVIDADGNRLGSRPIEVGEGPCGLALDEARGRLYVHNRFSSSVSVIDIVSEAVIDAIQLFDPTPIGVVAGRRHLYDTRRTSGLGQAACASCHVDARMDRLGWDLGDPSGDMARAVVNHQGTLATNDFHPMKGVMATQTLQDIIGHEPFHWRGDRADIEAFNATFMDLQGAESGLTDGEMAELREFLASIRFPPNAYRNFDNSLSTNMPLPGHAAAGEDRLPVGAPLPNGNALRGVDVFRAPGNFCVTCHTLPTGLGSEKVSGATLATGPNDAHHFPLATRLEGSLRSKVAQFQNMADKVGADFAGSASRAGFGFGHDGSIDSLTHFLAGVRVVRDQDIADLIALLLSVGGSDTPAGDGVPMESGLPPAATGRQVTIASPGANSEFDAMLALARSPASRLALIGKGVKDGVARGWYYDRGQASFQSDRASETATLEELVGQAAAITFTIVPRECAVRMGIDGDLDGVFDCDELDAGTDPATLQLLPRIVTASRDVAFGRDVLLEAQIPPLPAAGSITWWKEGEQLAGATNSVLTLTNVSFAASGDYHLVVTTLFQSYTSVPLALLVRPLIARVSPRVQSVWRGSNTLITAQVEGIGPFDYQWRFNSREISGAQSNAISISSAQLGDEGAYQVVVSNPYGAMTSAVAQVAILINPALVVAPLNQRVVVGGNVTFSAVISGHPAPFGFQLKKGSTPLTNYVSDEVTTFLTLSNVQLSNAGSYRIVVTNAANPAGLTLGPVTLTVLADSDGDGLPDEWEARNGFDTNNIGDADLDFDLDGFSNRREYLAGTNPRDGDSLLKLASLANSEVAVIQFGAASNKTYTVEYQDSLGAVEWRRWADYVALATNRTISVTNPVPGVARRYYRVVSPRVP